MGSRAGAGVIPFAFDGGSVYFLFHKTFSGRRAGLLVDFGGGGQAGETHPQTAAREFVEETEAMFLADDYRAVPVSEHQFDAQVQRLLTLLDRTQQRHPDWRCQRRKAGSRKPKDWVTYFVEVGYKPLEGMNREWAVDSGQRFKKRRELLWVSAAQLLDIYANQPDRLWKRVRELVGADTVIQAISTDRGAVAE